MKAVADGGKLHFNRGGVVFCLALFLASLAAAPAQAQLQLQLQTQAQQAPTRLIVRDSLGLPGINLSCRILGCSVLRAIGDPDGQLFVVTFPPIISPVVGLLRLNLQLGIVSAEIDQTVTTQSSDAGPAPSYLSDNAPASYYGTTVWHGYLVQPANQLIRTLSTQSTFRVAGAGVTVAVIDTGVDTTHPVLKNVLTKGYDFTRNSDGGSEQNDVNASPDPSQAQAGQVNQRTVAVLDQRTVAVLDGNSYSAFGHGTMTAGIVHLVAPQAIIMPLKAFNADGTGYDSDILRAIYYAVNHGAQVMNMSFDFASYSPELAKAIKYANRNGVISVASAGNDGQQATVYPAGLPSVIDVASTSNNDIRSVFTNYGAPPVWMAAPGEGVMTIYPWGTYAAGWGTSFSTPLVAGTAALILGQNSWCDASVISTALAHAKPISDPELGHGRLDTYMAVRACH
jgi:subtilisin family serine protease